MGDVSFGEMFWIVFAVIVLFGPKKIPEIARGLGQGIRKMRGAVEDIKTEIMSGEDNPIRDIRNDIDSAKRSFQEINPMNDLKQQFSDVLEEKKQSVETSSSKEFTSEDVKNTDPFSDEHNGPVSR